MSSTEAGVDSVRAVAGALFDELVVPLAEARKAAGRQSYFPLKGESGAKSYYVAPLASVMKPADFEFPGGGTADGLIDALTAYWADQGQTELAALAPRLKEVSALLREEAAESDGKVSILCYTMF